MYGGFEKLRMNDGIEQETEVVENNELNDLPEMDEEVDDIDNFPDFDDAGDEIDAMSDIADDLEGEVSPVVQNKLDGCRREEEVAKELEEQYPEEEGYKVLREKELCDKDGNPVIDEKTGSKRRVDFVVVKDGKVVDMIEVTSKTAPKRDQLAKEYRIRDNGGNYIKDQDGNIYRIPNNVETRVERRD